MPLYTHRAYTLVFSKVGGLNPTLPGIVVGASLTEWKGGFGSLFYYSDNSPFHLVLVDSVLEDTEDSVVLECSPAFASEMNGASLRLTFNLLTLEVFQSPGLEVVGKENVLRAFPSTEELQQFYVDEFLPDVLVSLDEIL